MITAAQVAVIRKKYILSDILSRAQQAGHINGVTQLKKPVAEAETQLSEVDSRTKKLLSLTLPGKPPLEQVQKFEEAYGKVMLGLKMEMAARDAELKQVDKIVEVVTK